MAKRSNGSIDDEDMVDITDWTAGDTGTGVSSQVTFDSKSCMKFDNGSAGGTYRYQDIGSYGTRTVISLNVYAHLLTGAGFYFRTNDGATNFWLKWDPNGNMYVYDGSGYNSAGSITLDTWEEWTFDINWTAETVDVYRARILLSAGMDISYSAAGTEGLVDMFLDQGAANLLFYIDWFKAGDDFTPSVGYSQAILIT